MIRKNLKILLTIFLIVIMSLSFSSTLVEATDAVTTSETEGTTTADAATTTEETEIYSGDLYLFDNKVVMDKLVDGNVFIFGQEVEITGQVNGDLFVCANKISFNQSYVKNTIFACANSVYYNGACNDLYVLSSTDLEMTYDSYVVRDLKALSSNVTLKSAIGRDVDLSFNSINLGEGEDIPIIYGNFRYTAPSEITIPEGVITETGTVTYTNAKSEENTSSTSVVDILVNFLICIVTALVIYALIKVLAPKFSEKLNSTKISPIELVKCFVIGLVSIISVAILFILLLITQVGIKLAFVLLVLFILLCLIAVPVFAIVITNVLKPVLKLENKKLMFCLVLSLVSIILYGLTLIPVVGGIFSLLITPISIGMLISMFIPRKELTAEEKIAIEEAKKQAKENKEKKKQEKTQAKKTKKKEDNKDN